MGSHAHLLSRGTAIHCQPNRPQCREGQVGQTRGKDTGAGRLAGAQEDGLTCSRRNQLILGDDPNFVPDLTLPPLDFDDNGELVIPGIDFSQRSKLSSQLSPLDHSSNSPANAPFINLKIRHSSSQGSIHLAPTFDKENQIQNDDGLFPMAFGEEEDLPFAEFPIRIDADGNLVEEPELPAHLSLADKNGDAAHEDLIGVHNPDDGGPVILGDEDAQMVFSDEEAQLPVVEHAPQNALQNDDVRLPSLEPLSSGSAPPQPQPQHPQRRQRRLKTLGPDAATQVGRSEFRAWTETYLSRAEEGIGSPQQVTAAQARKNAYSLVFGIGLGGVGVLNSIPGLNHELAQFFAGNNLEDIVIGNIPTGIEGVGKEDAEEDARGDRRRRSASVAFGSDDVEDDDGRRVRPRTGEGEHEQDQQAGRGRQDAQIVDDAMTVFDNEQGLLPELGREHPGSALSDYRRSSNAPWNRQPSMVPSSVRSGKNIEAGRNAVEQSPLVRRGSILQSDAKFSDTGIPALGSDGFAPFQNDGAHDFSSFGEFVVTAGVSTQEANTSQLMREALDREGRNFLGFVERVAADRGEQDAHNENLRWVEFDGLFDAQDKTRAVVARAFLHVLTLATKNQVRVKQTGAKEKEPFGEIRIGVTGAVQEELGGGVDVGMVEEMEDVEMGREIRGVEAHDGIEK